MNTDFLGKGFTFPLAVNSRGGIDRTQAAQKIKESIQIILGTQFGERVMRPTFGCNLASLAFAPNNKATANRAKYYVEEGLKTWEPRIILERVTVENDHQKNCLLIQIQYRIKSTYESQNLVYPFYLEQQS